MFKKIKRYCQDPCWALGFDMIKKCPKLMPDRFYIETLWRMIMGYKLDLNNPKTFNEKLQWLKLYNHDPLYTTLVDKLRAKDYVAKLVGDKHIVPTLAIYNDVSEIDLNTLPEQFVLKCNHDSGSVFVCKDKKQFEIESVKQKLDKCFHHNFYNDAREWAYKNVERKIFAEAFLEDDHLDDLVTYKFYCFSGEPKLMYTTVKNDDIWENFYDRDFNQIQINHGYPASPLPMTKPKCWDEMWKIAAKLSVGMPHVRIDLYEVKGVVYFSEYTFYDWGGLNKFADKEWDIKLGDFIRLQIDKR